MDTVQSSIDDYWNCSHARRSYQSGISISLDGNAVDAIARQSVPIDVTFHSKLIGDGCFQHSVCVLQLVHRKSK